MNLFAISLQVTSVTTVEHANEILRKLFLNQYRKSLLVLDDVWSAKIIKNFEVCARVLVTTQDISILDVIPKNNVKVIPIEGGFTPEESLKVHLNKSTIIKPKNTHIKVFLKRPQKFENKSPSYFDTTE